MVPDVTYLWLNISCTESNLVLSKILWFQQVLDDGWSGWWAATDFWLDLRVYMQQNYRRFRKYQIMLRCPRILDHVIQLPQTSETHFNFVYVSVDVCKCMFQYKQQATAVQQIEALISRNDDKPKQVISETDTTCSLINFQHSTFFHAVKLNTLRYWRWNTYG